VVDFERVVKLDKRNSKAYYGLGEARFRQGNYKRATDHFKDAKSLEPTNPLVYQYLMLCYMARSDFDEVKQTYEKFTEVASADEQLRFDRDRQFAAIREVINH
jgi:Flp pilus assembly protein TadD